MTGRAAVGLGVGDLAVSEQIVPCWSCRYCRRGSYHLCQQHDIYRFRRRTFGAMAEYQLYPADALNHRVPDSVPPAHAAYVEPLACAIHATQRGGIELGDVVVVAAGAAPSASASWRPRGARTPTPWSPST